MGKSLVSNPPYNMKWNIPLFAQIQPRFYDGVPPASNANFAFILTALNWIDDKAAFILPTGVLSTDNADEKINDISSEYGMNVQEASYLSIVEKLKENNMEIEEETVEDDNTIVLTINLE